MNFRTLNRRPGFSLVEVLITIAVIGVIVGIGVPMIGRIRQGAAEATQRANAHNLAATAASAVSAGSLALLASTSKEHAIRLLRDGVYGEGELENTRFQVTMRDTDATEASAMLRFACGLLVFEEP